MNIENKEDIIKNALNLNTNLQSGIYFLIQNNEIVYIGSSKNPMSRISAHKDKIFNKYFIKPCDINELENIEAEYIFKYNPKYNKGMPPNKNIKYVGQLKSSENQKIESVIIGGKLYIKSEFNEGE